MIAVAGAQKVCCLCGSPAGAGTIDVTETGTRAGPRTERAIATWPPFGAA